MELVGSPFVWCVGCEPDRTAERQAARAVVKGTPTSRRAQDNSATAAKTNQESDP